MNWNQSVAAQSTFWFPLAPLQLEDESDRMVAIGVFPVVLRDLEEWAIQAEKWNNADWWKVARTGGVTQVIVGEDGIGRGNGGVALPCKGCWIQVREGVEAWITTERDEDDGVGPFLPMASEGSQPIFLPISDVSKIITTGAPGVVADVVYLLG